MSYFLGETITLRTTFQMSGTYVKPNIVTLYLEPPSRVEYVHNYTPTGTVVMDATGMFSKVQFLNEWGQWWYRWFGTGTYFGTDEGYFMVENSPFGGV